MNMTDEYDVTMKQYYDNSEHFAKKLNNKASFYLMDDDRNYDKAIVLLTKALKEMEKNNLQHPMTAFNEGICTSCKCTCKNLFGESHFNNNSNNHNNNYDDDDDDDEMENENPSRDNFHQQQERKKKCVSSEDNNNNNYNNNRNNNNSNDTLNGFVYCQPFLVPKSCIKNKHYMGNNLSLIILFNLALAHHLKAITIIARARDGGNTTTGAGTTTNNDDTRTSTRKILQKTLQLYELAYQLIMSDGSAGYCYFSGSLRLTMIITNNLSEIHRIFGNTEKHKMCLQHLLCSIMYMVDSNIDNNVILNSKELDGFFCNVSPIMIGNRKDACAQIA
jgi:hypothetical protein